MKEIKTTFTHHALRQLEERTQITADEIAALLDRGEYTLLGIKTEPHIENLLFFSEKDNDCFVIPRDSRNGEVITILLAQFHPYCKFRPELAAELIARYHPQEEAPPQTDPSTVIETILPDRRSTPPATYLYFNAKLRKKPPGSKITFHRIKLPFDKFPESPESVANDPEVKENLKRIVAEQMPKYDLRSITFQYSNTGKQHKFNL